MASTIQLKTGTGSAVPSSLTQGEVGINIDNGLIFYGSGSGNVVKKLESFTNITASGDISASGDLIVNNITGVTAIESTLYTIDGVNAIDFASDTHLFGSTAKFTKLRTQKGLEVTAPITASGDISSSGTGSFGSIQSAGGISASNFIEGEGYLIQGNSFGHLIGADLLALGYQDNTPIQIGRSLNPLKIVGNITASKNITATGSIHTLGHITASGNISASGTGHFGGDLHLSDGDIRSNNTIDLLTTAGAAQGIRLGTLTLSQSYSQGTIALGAMSTTFAAVFGGDVAVGPHNNGNLGVGVLTPAAKLDVNGNITTNSHITASGNISASGTIIANKLEADALVSHVGDANTGLQFASDTVTIEGNDVAIGTFATNRIELNKPITASGDISASLNSKIFASSASFGGASFLRSFNVKGAGLDGRLSLQGAAGTDNPGIELTVNDNTSRALIRLDQVGTNGTALEFFTEPDGGNIANTLTIGHTGHITASGNISASGTIYGRQIEQHDMSAGGFIISDTTKTYFPFGGQSHLENTNNLNQNIQKLAVVPGKPLKVNIKSVSNATGLGNTGFSCSYWRVPDGFSGTSNLILVGEKRANSTGTSFEVVTFDFASGVDSGSHDDVQDGDLVFMTILGDDTLSNMNVLAATALWEWDYNKI